MTNKRDMTMTPKDMHKVSYWTLIITSVLFIFTMVFFVIHYIHEELILLTALAVVGAIYLGINLGLISWFQKQRHKAQLIEENDDA